VSPLLRNMIISALLLGIFAVLGTAVVSFTYDVTAETIADNEKAYLLQNLHVIISPDEHDNDIYTDTIQVTDPQLLGTPKPITVYRARRGGQPVAVVLTPDAPNGYGGAIQLLVGIYADGTLAGVRVLKHQETPGLGDRIEADRSDWILGFAGKSLDDPGPAGWAVKKDGGRFDQFTGATITPRAVVGAVHNALLYFQAHREQLFARQEKTDG
jgi:electron transport complex protein RnfG